MAAKGGGRREGKSRGGRETERGGSAGALRRGDGGEKCSGVLGSGHAPQQDVREQSNPDSDPLSSDLILLSSVSLKELVGPCIQGF